MTYVDGFVLAVPDANKEAYRKLATDASVVFKRHGAIGFVENWGVDVPPGKVNCLNSAVMRKPDETVMFSWIVWPDRAARDAGNTAVMVDPDLGGPGMEMPFDGMRMIYGGFEHLLGDALAAPGIVDGTVMPVPVASKAAYTAQAAKMADLFCEHGALSVVDAWSDDVPEGKVNSFHTAVLRKPDEAIVFSWINWKDAAAQEKGWAAIMADPRMEAFSPKTVGADMGRMIFGSFTPLVVA
ncbi:DUF1428 domain-containing protein [Hyphomonas sp.]|uniref:DUF1428 domain-containing protein n=1 Tax=Hyphomonas sp. TaxID=87 RepID=UPI00391CEEE9